MEHKSISKVYRINPRDTVAVALCPLHNGEIVTLDTQRLPVVENIPAGHKIAVQPIAEGEQIIKYGCPIGRATAAIQLGGHVHTHNMHTQLTGELSYTYAPDFTELPRKEPQTFLGYRRSNGRVGIRNEVWIIPTVGCVNAIVREIETKAQAFLSPHIDGIYAYEHPYGCSQLGGDMEMTLRFLAGLICHPNAAGILVVGLGCENGNIRELQRVMGTNNLQHVRFLNCQDVTDEIAVGVLLVRELCQQAELCRREPYPVSALTVGLKCGGSDGFSGITANPLLGAFSNRLISMGGSVVLTEVPEMFGAEKLLMRRCRTRKQFDDTVRLINDFKAYFLRYGEKVGENPSPGNKAGGITTLEEKSLGCVQKGGAAPVEDVLCYGETVRKCGLSLLQAPGNDLVAADALAASGAQLVLFTTGRGTPLGCPVPTVKISSNTQLFEKKTAWIDFDAGCLLTGEDREDIQDTFFQLILDIAGGSKKTKSERMDKHALAVFKDGVTL